MHTPAVMVDQVITKLGGAAEVARLIDVPYQTVAAWKRRGTIPSRHQRALLLAARERGLDITAEDLIGVARNSDAEAA